MGKDFAVFFWKVILHYAVDVSTDKIIFYGI